jgi:hypothetical protein
LIVTAHRIIIFFVIIAHHNADMDLNGKVALFPCEKTTVDIIDVATGHVVHQHDMQGRIGCSVSVQRNMAALAVFDSQEGVHVMDIKSGKVLCKFILPDGKEAKVALSADTLTLGVGTSTGR